MPIYKVNGTKKDGLQKYKVRVNFTSTDGTFKQLTRIAFGLDAARDIERQLNNEIKDHGKMPARKMTVQQLFDEYISAKQHEARETTVDKYKLNYKYYIQPTMSSKRIDKLSYKSLQDWKIALGKKDLSLNTKKQAFNDFRALLNYAVRIQYIHDNPLSKIGNFKDSSIIKPEMKIYTPQEFSKYINVAKQLAEEHQLSHNNLHEWDFYVFFYIAYFTGLRKGEIHALKWSDLDNKYLSVKRSVSQRLRSIGDVETAPKNVSSIRTLQMPLALIRVLDDQKERQRKLDYFSNNLRICGGEQSLRDSTLQRRNIKFASLAGLDVIRIHDFRHSHVSLLANEGINIQEIARRLGHARVEETWNTYSHMYPREEERAVEILDSFAA